MDVLTKEQYPKMTQNKLAIADSARSIWHCSHEMYLEPAVTGKSSQLKHSKTSDLDENVVFFVYKNIPVPLWKNNKSFGVK